MERTITVDLSSLFNGIAVGEPHPLPLPRPQTGPTPRPQFPFPFPKPVLRSGDVLGFTQDGQPDATEEQIDLDVEGYAYWIFGAAVAAGIAVGMAGGLAGVGYMQGARSQLQTAQKGIGYKGGYAAGKAAGAAGYDD